MSFFHAILEHLHDEEFPVDEQLCRVDYTKDRGEFGLLILDYDINGFAIHIRTEEHEADVSAYQSTRTLRNWTVDLTEPDSLETMTEVLHEMEEQGRQWRSPLDI